MIGVVIVTHGNLANEFRAALEHVVGPQEQIATICITPQDDIEECRKSIMDAIVDVNKGDGAVLLTDMFGGTPSNLAISVMDSAVVEVIAGINLPMLVKLARVRETASMDDAIREAQEAGRKYIHVASHVLNGK
ncbi:MAG: PTS sugar transporter subunit IIA [Hyphomicrobiales bacterium]|nr:PTS sugar transporter subunit IIA [Hyphomicrobiales bacterium]